VQLKFIGFIGYVCEYGGIFIEWLICGFMDLFDACLPTLVSNKSVFGFINRLCSFPLTLMKPALTQFFFRLNFI